MSFFDKFKKQAGSVAGAASGVAQNAVKQTKTLASVGRIKIAITTEEDKMKKAYTELGRLFYRDHEAQTEAVMEEYLPWIDKISDAKAQIARLNDEIVKVRAEAEEAAPEEAETAEVILDETVEAADTVLEDAADAAEEAAEEVAETVEEAAQTISEEPTVGTLYVDETNFED
ncbi:MAG: hypothetical protein IJ206_12990 [Oscillospiraceae bacterium]|nr:hypothetical protein [Oscillospiraceae bacterium]